MGITYMWSWGFGFVEVPVKNVSGKVTRWLWQWCGKPAGGKPGAKEAGKSLTHSANTGQEPSLPPLAWMPGGQQGSTQTVPPRLCDLQSSKQKWFRQWARPGRKATAMPRRGAGRAWLGEAPLGRRHWPAVCGVRETIMRRASRRRRGCRGSPSKRSGLESRFRPRDEQGV